MSTSLSENRAAHTARNERQKAVVGNAVRLVGAAAVIALLLRTLVFAPFNIPSESMLPRLLIGDYLFVAKWPYGYGRYSLPLGLPLFDGRIGGALPARGDVIVFKTPRDNRTDYIKRVIGLPGDQVQMVDGRVVLNGVPLETRRIDDFIVAAHGEDCSSGPGRPDFRARDDRGNNVCRYPAFTESLPGGASHPILDQIDGDVRDNTRPVVVPPEHLFVLGDNRDDSADSRFTVAEGGVGMVPTGNVIGRADRIFFSIAPSASLADPRSWLPALRTARIGTRL